MNKINILSLMFIGTLLVSCNVKNTKQSMIIAAHAHNDYLHKRPLFDALAARFKSVEADIFSVDGKLMVAHEAHEIQSEQTLEALYLEPLKQLIQQNHGSVYGEGTGLILFVDIKEDGLTTYKLLSQVLQRYAAMLTVFHRSGEVKLGPVTVVVSGERPLVYMQNEEIRYAGYDGRLPDLESDLSPALMPIISDKWTNYFSWLGEGEMPEDEQQKLLHIVTTAHAKGYQLRFWATPDKPGKARENVWTVLQNAQVDLIGTDDIKGLEQMLKTD